MRMLSIYYSREIVSLIQSARDKAGSGSGTTRSIQVLFFRPQRLVLLETLHKTVVSCDCNCEL
jgi:hypothetical protein